MIIVLDQSTKRKKVKYQTDFENLKNLKIYAKFQIQLYSNLNQKTASNGIIRNIRLI